MEYRVHAMHTLYTHADQHSDTHTSRNAFDFCKISNKKSKRNKNCEQNATKSANGKIRLIWIPTTVRQTQSALCFVRRRSSKQQTSKPLEHSNVHYKRTFTCKFNGSQFAHIIIYLFNISMHTYQYKIIIIYGRNNLTLVYISKQIPMLIRVQYTSDCLFGSSATDIYWPMPRCDILFVYRIVQNQNDLQTCIIPCI